MANLLPCQSSPALCQVSALHKYRQTHARVIDFVCVIFVLCLLNLHPGLFGIKFGKELLGISVLALAYLGSACRGGLNGKEWVALWLGLAFAFFCWIRLMWLGALDAAPLEGVSNVTAQLMVMLVGLVGGFTVSRLHRTRLVCVVICVIFVVLSLSVTITYVALLLGKEPAGVIEFTLGPEGLTGAWVCRIIFPFTLFAVTVPFLGEQLPRFNAMYSEPGVAQAYLITAFLLVSFIVQRRGWILKALLGVGVLATFSSFGYPLFALCAGYQAFMRRGNVVMKSLTIVAVIGTLVWMLNSEVLDYQNKLTRQGIVPESRFPPIRESWHALSDNPLIGSGIFTSAKGGYGSEGGTLLSSAHALGIVGLTLYALAFSSTLFGRHSWRTSILWVPFLVTGLLNEPVYLNGCLWFIASLRTKDLLFTDTSSKQE
jgi:hypothetical protein